MMVEIAAGGGGAQAMPFFFFPILVDITEAAILKGRQQMFSRQESITTFPEHEWIIGSLSLCEPTWGWNRSPGAGEPTFPNP